MAFASLWWLFLLQFIATFALSFAFIPTAGHKFMENGLSGVDYHRAEETKIPESLGLVVGMIFILSVVAFSPLLGMQVNLIYTSLLAISSALLLGFMDDVLNVRWRYKLLIPLVSAIPLIVNYAGETAISLPLFGVVELGLVYTWLLIPTMTVYMANAINIYAGINLLEVGQSIVLGGAVLLLGVLTERLFSVFMMTPFLAASLALAYYNRYPARVFVGNSYTYFSGMCIIVTSILSNMEKIIILCTIPQFLNFIYSMKDFLGECPQHRLPAFNKETGLLHDSHYSTLLNLILRIFGPQSEKRLVYTLISIQVVVSAIVLSWWYFLP
ncbi:MAG: UDP-N-acetylglucosamine--dolichyl-phosphate N-acetylglucosaminephosphotransferase [Promethearchaeota archaeon]